MSYPRVLHVGFLPIGSANNSGLTLGSMFGDWPEDRLLQLCVRIEGETPPPQVIVTPPSVAPVDGLARAVLGRSLRPGATDGLNHAVSRQGLDLPWRFRLRTTASVLNDVGPVHIPRKLLRQIEQFRPEVIHSLLGGVRPMRVASALSRRLGIPLVPHFMDDWVDTLFTDGQLHGYARRAVDQGLERVLERSPLCLTIGDDMALEYAERLHRPCWPVGNSVDLDEYRRLNARQALPPEPRRMRYVGGLHLGRVEVVRNVARALEVSAARARSWQLELFVPEADALLAAELAGEHAVVSHGGSLTPDRVPQALVDADALLFIESSAPHITAFTRLSVSTKVPQYLAAERPVLVLGPEEQSSVRAVRRSGLGVFGGDGTDPGVLAGALSSLDATVEDDVASRSSEIAAWLEETFGVAATRARLLDALGTAAREGMPR